MHSRADHPKTPDSRGGIPLVRLLVAVGTISMTGAGMFVGCADSSSNGGGGTGGDSAGATGGSSPNGTGGSQSGTGGHLAGTGGTITTGAGGGGSGTGGRTGTGGTAAGIGGTPGGTGGAPAPVTQYWVGPNGSNANPGTQAAPFATLVWAHAFARPGVTIWLLPGTYTVSQTVTLTTIGNATNSINLFAAPGTRPVLDFSPLKAMPANDNLRGIDLRADYWHLRGIEVKNANDNGINISGSHNTIEDVITDFNGDTGIQITVPDAQASDLTRGAFNTILNCDSHDNFDTATNGENADGIDAKLNIGPGNVFRGCRSYNNADDGYDLFGVTQIVTIDNCWAMLNGHLASGQTGNASDGNGFKLGGNNVPAVHVVTNSYSMTNDTCGYTLNNNTAQPRITGSGALGNKTAAFCSLTNVTGTVTITMTGPLAVMAQRVTNVGAGLSTLPVVH